MKAINPMGTKHAGNMPSSDVGTHQGRSYPTSKGQPPKAAMIDGPFGGKNKA